MREGVLAVNDSIATTPAAMLAGWRHYRRHPLVLIVGGHDRGLDWSAAIRELATQPPLHVCTQGANGESAGLMTAAAVGDRASRPGRRGNGCAVHPGRRPRRRAAAGGDGDDPVLLLSPGAPSFPQFADYVARGRALPRLPVTIRTG